MATSFDESLPTFVRVLTEHGLADILPTSVVLRDASGQLAFFANADLGAANKETLAEALKTAAQPFARTDRAVVARVDPGASSVLNDPRARSRLVDGQTVRYLDRRIVGADWLRPPSALVKRPPRFVFASLKGGVGRSTAISVVAAEAARTGRNVLVVDLDLEAPGIGAILLTPDRLPELGVLDYLVARSFGPYGDAIDALVGTSSLTSSSALVDVTPVAGRSSLRHPENVLAKISRGLVEGEDEDGKPLTLTDKIVSLLSELEARRTYDLVLVDARAGLAELAAGPILGLGAHVLLFGTAQRQTLEGYGYLFAHLATLIDEGQRSPWGVLKMVHAKADSVDSIKRHREELWDLFSTYLYDEQEGLDGLNSGPDNPEAAHHPLLVLNDPAFADWDPAKDTSKLDSKYYERTFGDLIAFVNDQRQRSLA